MLLLGPPAQPPPLSGSRDVVCRAVARETPPWTGAGIYYKCLGRSSSRVQLQGLAGDTLLSRAVNAAIGFGPLYAVMKFGARAVLKNTAHKNGVPWDATLRELRRKLPELEGLRQELEDPSVSYPQYYRQPFHAYEQGNLSWLPAFELEAATLSMGLRTFPGQGLTAAQAQERLREGIHSAIQAYRAAQGCSAPERVLDLGCSAGVSTRYLAAAFPAAQVTGLDLSPFFLAVAEHRRRSYEPGLQERIQYRHAQNEATGLPSGSFDLVCSSFVIHECPPVAIEALLQEARRLLRPGGVVAISDNDPRSDTIQNLPPALFTLMKSTEPWSDDYYRMDVEAAARAAGFFHVRTEAVDHRHRTVLGVAGDQ